MQNVLSLPSPAAAPSRLSPVEAGENCCRIYCNATTALNLTTRHSVTTLLFRNISTQALRLLMP